MGYVLPEYLSKWATDKVKRGINNSTCNVIASVAGRHNLKLSSGCWLNNADSGHGFEKLNY